MVVRHCQEICGCHFRINLQRRREAFCLAKRASTRLIYTKERFAPRGRTVVVTASLCPRRRSVEFCDDCPHFLLPSSPTGCGRRKCSRTLNSVLGEGECPLWQQKRTPIRCPFLLAEKERFELSNPVTGYTISNRAPSTS